MTHDNYFEIEAESYFELGLRAGELFGEVLHETLQEQKNDASWTSRLRRSTAYLRMTAKAFPHLIEEFKGYAEGAGVSLEDLWVLNVEDELAESVYEKCTTIVTNSGYLITHNEDWQIGAQDAVCVLRKTVADLSILELFYFNTLGGNAVSINSHGVVQALNTLNHTDHQVGVPRNIIARWLSETSSPDRDYRRLTRLRRASGFHHALVSSDGRIWSIECCARRQILTRPDSPFIHTNHFLTGLGMMDNEDDSEGSFSRYICASEKVSDPRETFSKYFSASENVSNPMSVDMAKELASDTSEGETLSVFNNRTIARVIIDLAGMNAYFWLLREKEKGWVRYAIMPER